MNNFLDEINWRGLLHQTTGDRELLQKHLNSGKRIGYIGFDPSRESLTIGNFLQIKILMHWQRAGHVPLVLIGGGTGLIGDPSGKDQERQLLDYEKISQNASAQENLIRRFLDFNCSNSAIVANNYSWLSNLKYIEVLRDVGKYFSVNAMLQKDSVRDRLQNREQGISYTEFSYMILQAYDFLHLRKEHDCTVQLAGSDQYGNIVAGIDLIRRYFQGSSEETVLGWGITTPLLTDSEGKKIGKTEKGAVWLDPAKTSPYRFYQFWLNQEDAIVSDMLRWFTFLSQAEIDDLIIQHLEAPHLRKAQQELAKEVTTLIHGESEYIRARSAAEALFGGNIAALDERSLFEICADVPATNFPIKEFNMGGELLVDILSKTSLSKSKRESREFLLNGSIAINGVKIIGDDVLLKRISKKDFLYGKICFLKRGKRHWHALCIQED